MSNKIPWGRLLDSPYLDSYDFDDNEKKVVTFEKIYTETVIGGGGREDRCIIADLKGITKKLIITRPTGRQIEKALKSRFTSDWIGKSVTLFINPEKHFGSMHNTIRAKTNAPIPKALPKLEPKHPKWAASTTYLKDGGTIAELEKHYIITPENKALLCAK